MLKKLGLPYDWRGNILNVCSVCNKKFFGQLRPEQKIQKLVEKTWGKVGVIVATDFVEGMRRVPELSSYVPYYHDMFMDRYGNKGYPMTFEAYSNIMESTMI